MRPPHGGRLGEAVTRWGRPADEWLDLSTGIAPWSWPVPEIPPAVWARLPEDDDGLIAAAAAYYQTDPERIVAVPGSQFAIRAWPRLQRPGTVAVPATGYSEHARAWAAAGHRLWSYRTLGDLEAGSQDIDHAVVLWPNNPTGEIADTAFLTRLSQALGPARLLIDAAFLDCRIPANDWPEDAIVLRSTGKFFGLAGIRLGFVIGDAAALAPIATDVAPWGVAHPARWIGCRALRDHRWQAEQRARIAAAEQALIDSLHAVRPDTRLVSGGLFATWLFAETDTAIACHETLAAQGVLTRLGDNQRWLRFGLARSEDRPRLVSVLRRVSTA